jgi:hypothetical protein
LHAGVDIAPHQREKLERMGSFTASHLNMLVSMAITMQASTGAQPLNCRNSRWAIQAKAVYMPHIEIA